MNTTETGARPNRALRFRNDIDLESTWVVSDTHFGHDNIVGFCHRPEDHEQVMLAEWRKEVPDDATVLHLGDLCYRSNGRFKNIIAKELTGARKLLVQGNHDRQRFSFYKQSGFQIVSPFALALTKTDSGLKCVERETRELLDLVGANRTYDFAVSFCHYQWGPDEPQLPTEDGAMHSNHYRLHGHIHNNGYTREAFVPFLKNHINLSVEQTKYRPVNLKVLLDAALLGLYEATSEESLEAARARRAALGGQGR